MNINCYYNFITSRIMNFIFPASNIELSAQNFEHKFVAIPFKKIQLICYPEARSTWRVIVSLHFERIRNNFTNMSSITDNIVPNEEITSAIEMPLSRIFACNQCPYLSKKGK